MLSHPRRRIGREINFQLQSRRQIWPIVAAGVGVYVAGTAITYVIRAYKRMQNENSTSETSNVSAEESSEPSSSTHDAEIKSVIGIDLGTSFSKTAIFDMNILSVVENREGKRSVPAFVYKHAPEEEGLQTGTTARAARFVKPNKTLGGFTMRLNDHEAKSSMIDGEPHDVDSLCTLLAKELVNSARDKIGSSSGALGRTVAILSSPNSFSQLANERLLKSVRAAGIEALATIPDGIASIIGAVRILGNEGAALLPDGATTTVCVIDVGSAITQLSLIQCEGSGAQLNKTRFKLINEKTVKIGGETFDASIVAFINSEFGKRNGGINLLLDGLSQQRCHDAAEVAKHDLSSTKSTRINIPFISATANGPLHIDVPLTRSQLEEILSQDLKEIKKNIKEILYNGGATAPLRAVLLVGGGARMPAILTIVEDVTGGMRPITVPAPEEVAVLGAAALIDSRFVEE